MVADRDLLVHVLTARPLRLHVALLNPDGAAGPVWVPRLLRPLGAFVRLAVLDGAGETRFETTEPKFKPKLRPEDDESYLSLEPGYSHGAIFEAELGEVAAGAYTLRVTYRTLDYRGSPDRPVGEVTLTEESELVIGD
ncbi:hypothetical protein [Occultella kanbiaonis]|uniref:hypothetical protein n=1 Tax=Occultella kanbiaonis TaxID=2675754 RepID=UPI0013D83379|nr:hypothetical protein [Occultella kanbiaonis]